MRAHPHERFSRQVTLTPAAVAGFARDVGVVELRGRIRGADGRTAVGARGRVLVTDAL